MSYLSLCQRGVRLASIGGAQSGKPDTVSGNPHRVQLMCEFVAEAAREIESMYADWTFMRPSVDFFIEADVAALDPSLMHPDVISINKHAVFGRSAAYGESNLIEQRIFPASWPAVREMREAATVTPVIGIPTHFAASPDGLLQFYPTATHPFMLRAECVVRPSVLAADEDEPRVPETHQDVIVYRALTMYHEQDEAPELAAPMSARFDGWMARLEGLYLPDNAWSLTHSPEVPLVVRPC